MEVALKDAIEGETEEDVRDVARLVCLYFMISLLFISSNHTLRWFFVQWIKNLDQIGDYNWAIAAHEFLLYSIIRKTHDLAWVKGCVPLLLVSIFLYCCNLFQFANNIFLIYLYLYVTESIVPVLAV